MTFGLPGGSGGKEPACQCKKDIEDTSSILLYHMIWGWKETTFKFHSLPRKLSVLSCLTLCSPVDWSPPDSSVHEIFQARILEWVAIFYSRGSSWPRNQTWVSFVSCIGRWILYHCATWEAQLHSRFYPKFLTYVSSSSQHPCYIPHL